MRLKIIAGNVIAILVVGLLSFFSVKSQIESALTANIDTKTVNDAKLFDRSWRLSVVEFVDQVRDRAQSGEVQGAFGGLDEESRRQRAFDASGEVSRWFNEAQERGAPDIVAIADETGKVIARDKDIHRLHGKRLAKELPKLRPVLNQGRAQHDVWYKKDADKLLQTGMAPIRNEGGTIIGALVVGYDLSNGLAESEAELLGREVAFLHKDRIYSSSLEADQAERLQKHLFGELASQTKEALGGKASTPWNASFGESDYVGVTSSLAKTPSTAVAYTVLANRTEQVEIASSTYFILLFTILGLIGVAVYGFLLGTSFIRPLEKIEDGVLQVINGRTDHRINVDSQDFGGLAYRINQLINVFTGVAEEDEEGRVSQPPGAQASWQGSAFSSESSGTSQAAPSGGGSSGGGQAGDVIDDPNVAAQLEGEPEDQYLERVYKEYVAAKQSIGEDVSNIPQERFAQRLKGNAQALTNKHGCRDVRFQVETRGNQVVLRPVLIR